VKLYWNEKTVNGGHVLELLFGDRKDTLAAARLLISRMKRSPHLAMTRREMRFFAKELEGGKSGVKYSYHNFYVKLLRKLLDMGFIEKDVLIWDEKRKKTEAVYQIKLQAGWLREAGLATSQGLERVREVGSYPHAFHEKTRLPR